MLAMEAKEFLVLLDKASSTGVAEDCEELIEKWLYKQCETKNFDQVNEVLRTMDVEKIGHTVAMIFVVSVQEHYRLNVSREAILDVVERVWTLLRESEKTASNKKRRRTNARQQ